MAAIRINFYNFARTDRRGSKDENNGVSGCGNDLAIDDIRVRSCGDFASISSTLSSNDTYSVCINNVPATIPLAIETDTSSPHVFQWQQSMDFVTWTDIAGANAATYNVDPSQSAFYYRARIARISADVSIYDRYGKLLTALTPSNLFWDGKLNGELLPSTDYWYRGVFDGKEITGHFSLKR